MRGPVFLDLDGVLLDVCARYHSVHLSLPGALRLSRAEFWRRKRAGEKLEALLEPGADAAECRRLWLERVEGDDQLALDRPLPGAREAVEKLRASGAVCVVTLRRRTEAVVAQAARLFPGLVVLSAPHGAEAWKSKRALIERSGAPLAGGWLAGDTEVDVKAGKSLGLRTAGVLSGLRDRERLSVEKPDVLIETISTLPGLVEARA